MFSIAVISVELGSKVGVQLLRRSFLQHFLLAAKWTGDVCRRGVQHDGVYCMRLVVVGTSMVQMIKSSKI